MAASRPTTLVLHVSSGADPASYGAAVGALRQVPGVLAVVPDVLGGTLQVAYDSSLTSVPALVGCLAGHGLPPSRARVLDDGLPDGASG